MKITKENIYREAMRGNLEVLKHKKLAILKDFSGRSPLHWLGWRGIVEILEHKEVASLRDNSNETPLHFLAWRKAVPREYIKKTFPWFELGEREITPELITEILETNNACKFIKTI